MAKDEYGNTELGSQSSVIRSNGSLNKEALTLGFKKLHESYIKEYNRAAWDSDDQRKMIADAKRDLICELGEIFGLEYHTEAF